MPAIRWQWRSTNFRKGAKIAANIAKLPELLKKP